MVTANIITVITSNTNEDIYRLHQNLDTTDFKTDIRYPTKKQKVSIKLQHTTGCKIHPNFSE